MSDPTRSPRASREFVIRTIQWLMLVDVAVGGVLVLLGLFVVDLPALTIGGAVLACMGLGMAVLFQVLRRRVPAAGRDSPHQLRR